MENFVNFIGCMQQYQLKLLLGRGRKRDETKRCLKRKEIVCVTASRSIKVAVFCLLSPFSILFLTSLYILAIICMYLEINK